MKLTKAFTILLLLVISYSTASAQKVHPKWHKKHHHVKHHHPIKK